MKIALLLPVFLLLSSCFRLGSYEKDFYPEALNKENGTKSWTIMVYMNGDNSLSQYIDYNIRQMKTAEVADNINIIILSDKDTDGDTSLIHIRNQQVLYPKATWHGVYLNQPQLDSAPEIDMLTEQTLSDFIDFSKSYAPADHYALILWGHADGWRSDIADNTKALTTDEHPGGMNILNNNSISNVLNGKGIEIVGFDACLQSTIETIWSFKIRNSASIFIASPNTIPGTGWNYYLMLKYFNASYRRPYDFAEAAVNSYRDTYSSKANVSLTAYDLNKLDTEMVKNLFIWLYEDVFASAYESKIFCEDTASYQVLAGGVLDYYYKDFIQYVSLSYYPQKAALKTMLNNFNIFGWKSGVGNSFKGLAILGISSTDSNIFDTDYPFINFSMDTGWWQVLYSRDWKSYPTWN